MQQMEDQEDGNHGQQQQAGMDPKTAQYLVELLKEKHSLNMSFPHASRFLDEEIHKIKETGRASRDYRYVDVFRERPTKVVAKVIFPIREFPNFNFVGKLLGPKGNTLKRLQEETMCKMSIYGRGSMRDRQKEEELRQSLDPKYAHLSEDLHVEISALAAPAEAHARMAYALAEIRKYLLPDSNDEISHQQLLEMGKITEDGVGSSRGETGKSSGGGGRGGFRGGRGGGRSGGPGGRNQTIFDKTAGGGYQTAPQSVIPDDNWDDAPVYSTRNTVGTGNLGIGNDESGRGRWKQQAGNSRFSSRSAPYQRRS